MSASVVIQKNPCKHLRMSLAQHRGHELVDVRGFVGSRVADDIVLAKWEVCFRFNKLPVVITPLQATVTETRRRGLL